MPYQGNEIGLQLGHDKGGGENIDIPEKQFKSYSDIQYMYEGDESEQENGSDNDQQIDENAGITPGYFMEQVGDKKL